MKYDIASKRLVELAKESILEVFLGITPERVELIEQMPDSTVSVRTWFPFGKPGHCITKKAAAFLAIPDQRLCFKGKGTS